MDFISHFKHILGPTLKKLMNRKPCYSAETFGFIAEVNQHENADESRLKCYGKNIVKLKSQTSRQTKRNTDADKIFEVCWKMI